MKNKWVMTVGGAIAALCPWAARAETFPSDGVMLENKTYESAATYDNLGTYEGSVSAAAEYTDVLYQVGAGQYLPAGSEGVGAICVAGNYCPGLTDATYSESSDQGLNACPNGYPMSESGASVNTQCYTPCTDKSVIAHATAVAGNDYYGNGVDTCYATACDNGYHPYNGIEMIEQDPLISISGAAATTIGCIAQDGNPHNKDVFGLTENGTWAAQFSYGSYATVYGQASCQAVLSDEVNAMHYYSGMMISPDVVTAEEVRAELLERVDADKANAVADVFAEYKAGTKTEEDAMKAAYAILGSEYDADFSKNDSGQYCFCQMTSFTQSGQSEQVTVTSAPWVFRFDFGSADVCVGNCAGFCASGLEGFDSNSPAYLAAVLGSLGRRTVSVCAANEISITWADADPADVADNNAGVCTYDGDIRTPVKAVHKPGKTFKGWTFSKKN